jgi:hypothetical protein
MHAGSAHEPPRFSVVLRDAEDQVLKHGILPSFSGSYQREAPSYEVLVVAGRERRAAIERLLPALGVPARFLPADDPSRWLDVGFEAAAGDSLLLGAVPAIATPTLLASAHAALDTYRDSLLIVPTFELEVGQNDVFALWLSVFRWPAQAYALVDNVTSAVLGPPRSRWLDPPASIGTIIGTREVVQRACTPSGSTGRRFPTDGQSLTGIARVQLVGDGLAAPRRATAPVAVAAASEPAPPASIDPDLGYFGTIHDPTAEHHPLTERIDRAQRPSLSVIVIVHDMQREAPRTLYSLTPAYQRGMAVEDYEVLVVENGSKAPLDEAAVRRVAPNVSYHYLRDPPPSPAYAINYAAARATGDVLAIVIDGACLLSPGVLTTGLLPFRAFSEPVVVTRYFVLGPGLQRTTVLKGYDQAEEDRLLARIGWPLDGYRLFEISSPLTFLGGPTDNWFTRWFESNCLFVSRALYEAIGGCDERFDYPGGGSLNIDLFLRACDHPNSQPVELIGEGVFHQVHGGITSNTSPDDAAAKTLLYEQQYRNLRGKPIAGTKKSFFFLGRLDNPATRWKMEG